MDAKLMTGFSETSWELGKLSPTHSPRFGHNLGVLESLPVIKPNPLAVILGDTCDNTGIEEISRDADVVVHEATHQDELEDKAIMFGHSTPSMAAKFCQKINSRSLILTHFSQRYLNTPGECREGEVLTIHYERLMMLPAKVCHDLGQGLQEKHEQRSDTCKSVQARCGERLSIEMDDR
eukprot:sb/3471738/